MTTDKKKSLSFEDALTQLETIVTRIEAGQVPLEESIDCYAQGITLLKQCRGILSQAEEKIQLLSESQGAVTVEGELPDEDADA